MGHQTARPVSQPLLLGDKRASGDGGVLQQEDLLITCELWGSWTGQW